MIHGSVGGTRKRGVGCGSAFKKPEALWTGSAMALKEAEPEALKKMVAPPSLVTCAQMCNCIYKNNNVPGSYYLMKQI